MPPVWYPQTHCPLYGEEVRKYPKLSPLFFFPLGSASPAFLLLYLEPWPPTLSSPKSQSTSADIFHDLPLPLFPPLFPSCNMSIPPTHPPPTTKPESGRGACWAGVKHRSHFSLSLHPAPTCPTGDPLEVRPPAIGHSLLLQGPSSGKVLDLPLPPSERRPALWETLALSPVSLGIKESLSLSFPDCVLSVSQRPHGMAFVTQPSQAP